MNHLKALKFYTIWALQINNIYWVKDVAEGAVFKAVEVVLIPTHPFFVWMLLKILFFSLY